MLTEIRGEWPSHGMMPLIRTRVENGRAILEVLAPLAGDPAGAPSMSRLDTGGRVVTSLEDVQPIYPDVDSMRQLLISWRSRFFHFRALRTGTQRTQNSVSAERLEPTGGNLASVLLYLATDRPDMFRQLGDLVSEIVPDIGRLNVRTLGLLRVVFEDSAGDLNLKDLGTGVEQLLMTLTVGLMEAAPFTLIMEEPETNLHPAAQRALLGLLQTWASDRQVIAATHSPVMLDWSPGGDRLWHVIREQGVSRSNRSMRIRFRS